MWPSTRAQGLGHNNALPTLTPKPFQANTKSNPLTAPGGSFSMSQSTGLPWDKGIRRTGRPAVGFKMWRDMFFFKEQKEYGEGSDIQKKKKKEEE